MKIKHISFMRIESRYLPKSDIGKINDMLRYDHCFQWTKDPQVIAYPVFQTKTGNLGGRVSSRWDSFGIRVIGWMDESEENAPSIHNIRMDEWVSYRHPHTKDGPHDYTRLVPVTLAEYQRAKDTDELALDA